MITASRKTEPTKKITIRATTDFVARAIARSGSRLSAAAMVTTSAPTIEKITTTMAAKTAPTPLGKKPPWEVRLEKSRCWPGPAARSTNSRADTEEDHDGRDFDSGEPEFELTERRHREQIGGCHQQHQAQRQQPQRRRKPIVEDLSAGDCLESDDDHPEVPIQPADREPGPAAQRLARRNRRTIRSTDSPPPSRPASASPGRSTGRRSRRSGTRPGPVFPDDHPEPTNNPAPITPPIAIMLSCRCESPCFSVALAVRRSTVRVAFPRMALPYRIPDASVACGRRREEGAEPAHRARRRESRTHRS